MASIQDILVQSGIFILLLCLMRPWLKRALSARARHALWLIPALRLALPFRINSPLSLWAWLAPVPAKPAALAPLGPVPFLPTSPVLALPSVQGPVVVPQASPLPAVPSAAGLHWSAWLPQMLMWAWLAGAVVMLGYVIMSNLRLKRPIKGIKPFYMPDSPLPLYVVPGLASPCLAGLFRPRIMLSPAALQTDTLLHMVISHELCHWRRKDHLWAAFRSLLLCAWWWNPLVWLMASLSQEDSEAACDEAVTLPMDQDKREAYGMSLIALMQPPHKVRLLGADTAMSNGKRQMTERITMIANLKKKHWAPALALTLVLALLMPLVFTSASEASPAPQSDAPPASTINTQEIIQMMTEEEAITAAKDAVMSYVVYDAGIQGFSNIKAEIAWKEWAGIWSSMWVVTLDATAGNSQEQLEVHVLPEDKAAVYIGQGGQPLWEGPVYRAEIPRNKNQQAWAKNAAYLNNYPYANDYPAMILFPGAPVTIARVTPAVGNNTQEEWADVILGSTDNTPEVSGYVLLERLVDEKPEAPSLKASVQKEGTPLLKNTGLSDAAWRSLTSGQELTLLGQSLRYYYVQAGDATGYVPLDALDIDEKTQAALAAFQPDDPFDSVQPGWMPRKAEYEKKLHTLYNQYGDVGTWPLEARAQGSKIALEYGFTWLYAPDGGHMIQVLPASGEMGQEEAYQTALKAAMAEYGFDEKAPALPTMRTAPTNGNGASPSGSSGCPIVLCAWIAKGMCWS